MFCTYESRFDFVYSFIGNKQEVHWKKHFLFKCWIAAMTPVLLLPSDTGTGTQSKFYFGTTSSSRATLLLFFFLITILAWFFWWISHVVSVNLYSFLGQHSFITVTVFHYIENSINKSMHVNIRDLWERKAASLDFFKFSLNFA